MKTAFKRKRWIAILLPLTIIVGYYAYVFVFGGWWPAISSPDYSAISVGMSKQEVIDILGEPLDAHYNGDSGWMAYGYTSGLMNTDIDSWHPKSTMIVIEGGEVRRLLDTSVKKNPW